MEKSLGRIKVRILEIYGSDGLPSCGMTDAAIIGQGVSDTQTICGAEETILPGTPRSLFPIALLHKLIPDKMPKSVRNWNKKKK